MSADSRIAVGLMITGRVQGVWFRDWTVKSAAARGLDGWVRNRRDGAVEAMLCGPDEQVRAMIEACHEGPPMARVDGVEVTDAEVIPPGTGFSQRDTA